MWECGAGWVPCNVGYARVRPYNIHGYNARLQVFMLGQHILGESNLKKIQWKKKYIDFEAGEKNNPKTDRANIEVLSLPSTICMLNSNVVSHGSECFEARDW